MKTLSCKTLLLLAAIFAVNLSLSAQTLREEDKKEFAATGSTELSIDNQFGNITVTDWDQNTVSITYIIEVTHSDEAKAKKLMDKIKVEIKEDGSKIKATTKLGEDGKLNMKNKGDKQSFRIDYFVKCPKSIKVSLDNQFGDLIISSLTGSFKADLQFGSLNAVSLAGPETKVDMQFGKLTIGSLKEGKIDVQHCESLKISECGSLSLDAQFSKVEIGNIKSFDADLNHCEVTVDALDDMLKLDSNMGNLRIGNISPGFNSIIVDQNMGDLSMGIDPKAGYKLDAEVNMGSIKVPEGLKLHREKESEIPGVSAEKVYGTYGNGESSIRIECNMGSVKIR